MKLIIDTDAGVDDAQAIMLALAHPGVETLAITTLTGNVHIRQVNPNVLTILEIMGRDVPVYAGIDRPLISEWEDAAEFHGGDGLGNLRERPALTRRIEDEHAVLALLRLAREHEGELTLIALGPLTNIAAAVRIDPAFPGRIKQFVFMGGTIAAQGNTPIVSAEYNIWTDPEAAAITLAAFKEATMLSWETTMAHGFPWDQFNALCAIDTARGRFFRAISQETAERLRGVYRRPAYLLPDPLAMAITLRPQLIRQSGKFYTTVELTGRHTRGQTVIDYTGISGNAPNVNVIQALDTDGVYELFVNALSQE
ncbi:MAG: nucleoside hydrolase [Chloroflexota bacterium]|nr:nucleoside hydrolase [Chloroflexota bacterium]